VEATPILYVVATPVGNLADMVPRAIEVLQTVDVIAAEDTRRSRPLLKHFGIDTRLVAYHDHSDGATVEKLLDLLRGGQSLALISDAGTPLISDPGFRLVDAVLAEGIKVVPVPGACAMVAALSVAGLPSDRFVFEGFLPAKQGARVAALSALEKETRTLIFYEAPHRLLESLRDISSVMGADRVVVLARELTKLYETVVRKPAAELAEWVAADADQQRGECVVLVAGYRDVLDESLPEEGVRVLKILCDELPLKQACALAAQITGIKKNRLYQYALDELK
jgi:16S rRNA (cytidine1402-2'-O)-methyltransferase